VIDSNKTFLHIDINSYFATMLQQETPALRGKPLAIVKDEGRTCIIAASKEAKKLGVKTGSRMNEALTVAPEIIAIPADFDLYWSATCKLKKLFESLSPDVSMFSLDEAFLDYTPLRQMHSSPQEFAKLIQSGVKDTLGSWVTCSIGISHNRFLAKMTGEVSGPDSITTIDLENKDLLLSQTDFKDVCGIGPRLARRLKGHGVVVPYQINFIPDGELKRSFGPFWSVELRRMGRGEEPLFLSRLKEAPSHMKSVGRSITGWQLCNSESVIKRTLYNLVSEIIYKVRSMNLAGRLVSISVNGGGRSWSNHVTLKHHICHTGELFQYVYYDLYKKWRRPFPVIKLAVRLGLLESRADLSQSLLPKWQKEERVSVACDKLVSSYGLFAVTSGLLARGPIIRPEVTGFLGDKQYQFM